MIAYQKEMPPREQIEAALFDVSLNLDKFLAQPVCQFCAGVAKGQIAEEGQFVCDCKITRVNYGMVVAHRCKYENVWHNEYDGDATPPEITEIRAPRVLIETVWVAKRKWGGAWWETTEPRLLPKITITNTIW
jgi:hypothetical protein